MILITISNFFENLNTFSPFSANQLLNLPGKSKVPINYCVIEVNHGQTVTYEVLVNKVILIFYLAFC